MLTRHSNLPRGEGPGECERIVVMLVCTYRDPQMFNAQCRSDVRGYKTFKYLTFGGEVRPLPAQVCRRVRL